MKTDTQTTVGNSPTTFRFWPIIKKYKQELLFVLGFVLLIVMDPSIGGTYILLEIVWDISAVMTAVKYTGAISIISHLKSNGLNFQNALDNANQDKPSAWKWFLVNRTVAFIQPVAGLVMAIFIVQIPFRAGWYGYVYMVFDLLHTIWAIPLLQKRLWPKPSVRVATLSDVPRLMEIDRDAFPLEEQQASRKSITRRLETSPNTCLVLDDPKDGVVGVIYARPMNLSSILKVERLTWPEIENNGDFTPPTDADCLYVVGIASFTKLSYDVASVLEPAIGGVMVKLGYSAVLGGLRIPGYHKMSNLPLDEYVQLKNDKGRFMDPMLRKFVESATIPLIGSLVTVLRGIEEYFEDPESMNCAALIMGSDPLRKSHLAGLMLNKSAFIRGVWSKVFEWLMKL